VIESSGNTHEFGEFLTHPVVAPLHCRRDALFEFVEPIEIHIHAFNSCRAFPASPAANAAGSISPSKTSVAGPDIETESPETPDQSNRNWPPGNVASNGEVIRPSSMPATQTAHAPVPQA
jgi:hypothetical protein